MSPRDSTTSVASPGAKPVVEYRAVPPEDIERAKARRAKRFRGLRELGRGVLIVAIVGAAAYAYAVSVALMSGC
jgi:hypothetical protein